MAFARQIITALHRHRLPVLGIIALLLIGGSACRSISSHTENLQASRQAFWETLYSQAAEGDTVALMRLGTIYREGLYGKRKDYAEAAKWFRLATERGNFLDQIGQLYDEGGFGLNRDRREAAKWHLLAAEHGNHTSQFRLGEMYAEGDGVTQDHSDALFWMLLAYQYEQSKAPNYDTQRLQAAERYLKSIKNHLSPHDIKAIELRVRNWKPKPAPGIPLTLRVATLINWIVKGT